MNILHINDKIENSGGVETNISQLVNLGKDYGLCGSWIGIYTIKGSLEIKIYPNDEIVFKGDHASFFVFIKNYIVEKDIDIIHIHSLSSPKLLEHFFKLKPVVRSIHEPRILCPGQGKFWRKSEEICNKPFGLHCILDAYKEGCCNRHPKRLLEAYSNVKWETTKGNKGYSALIANSEYIINEAIKVGFTNDKLYLNPHMTPLVEERELKDRSKEKCKSLLFVGRLSRTKGVHYFINLGLELLKKGHNITLDIVGDGHDRSYFESLIPEEYNESFHFHGWQTRENINSFFKNCYLLVFPSIYPEAFGISGIEAMMHGKPVVGFDVGGVNTWLKHNETGYLVPVKEERLLIKRIEILLNDIEKYNSMCKKARTVALKEFQPKIHMGTLYEIYQNCFNKNGF
ncbi:glycosyltransferase family 4 protein [Winogradskyella endarachnes]|uniref:Glycosyltransferase n=1 Tax=Winogradskyella endarachnes TaxID=2681965 RepID=A0A6L6U6L8_9FLAO|nr:glycosyltransferase family 4 protein [Winogradskyella endarachnes]MUU77873.1 glycosyltransferase [Winogradskyella endarachnes]